MKLHNLSVLLLSSATAPSLMLGAADRNHPNVLFLLADDMTFEAISALGNDEVITPNLDRLVRSGVALTNTFNMGGWAGAVSVASRSMLMTGKYLWNAKAAEDAKYTDIYQNGGFWPQVMKQAGYRTYMTGKWHVSHYTPDKMFDETEGVKLGGMLRIPTGYNRPLSEDDHSWEPWEVDKGGYWQKDGCHWSEIQADYIIHYIERNSGSEEPLFMYVAFNAPHDPRQSPKEYVDMYDVDKIKVPENFQPEHPMKELMGCSAAVRDEALAPFPRTEYAVRKHRQEYYSIITHLDTQIGRILDALEKSPLASNTIIVLTGDNGLSCGHHGLIGKQNVYEPSMKVPMIVSGPSIPKGKIRKEIVYMQDVVPTLYELCGISKPEGNQYRSFLPVIKSASAKGRDAIYGAYQASLQRMSRDKRYKLYFILEAKTVYLFDLKKDPNEMHDLYGNPKYGKVVRRLCDRYVKEAAAVGDTLDMSAYYPDLFPGK